MLLLDVIPPNSFETTIAEGIQGKEPCVTTQFLVRDSSLPAPGTSLGLWRGPLFLQAKSLFNEFWHLQYSLQEDSLKDTPNSTTQRVSTIEFKTS